MNRVTLNQRFISQFLDAPAPCFALAHIQRSGRTGGSIVIRLPFRLPANLRTTDFRFEQSPFWVEDSPLLCVSIKFRSGILYHGLASLHNSTVKVVFESVLKSGECPLLLIDSAQTAIAMNFPTAGLIRNLAHLWQNSGQRWVNPLPIGQVMQWVCYEDLRQLDLNGRCAVLEPAISGRCGDLR